MSLIQVRLARDSFDTPWGFRLQGGKDLNQPLTIQRVFTNTPSEGELHRGDIIVTINGRDTSSLTHKQAQDLITKGGGQIEFLVQRPPPGQVHITPLSPVKDTKAPRFPPTKAPQIVIPIQKLSGPQSPHRNIPVSPPSHPSPSRQQPQSVHHQHQHQHQQQYQQQHSPMAAAGHMPKKVTLNKYGGGGMDFGIMPSPAARQAAQERTYRPVPAPAPAPVNRPPPQQDTTDYPFQQTQNQFSAPQGQFSPTQDERGVEEEVYGGVGDRRRKFIDTSARQPPIQRSRKPIPAYGRSRSGGDGAPTFGVDYKHPQPSQPKPAPKFSNTPKQRPPPVNSYDDTDWSTTLRNDKSLKPWEREALEAEKYQSSTIDQPYRPSQAPPAAPKPRITTITAQSKARPAESAPSHAGHSSNKGKKQPVPIGDRDWSDSYVYQMVHSEQKSTTSSRQDYPGGQPQGETVTTTRVVDEQRFPGQEPQRHVTETVQRSPMPYFQYDSALGTSDF